MYIYIYISRGRKALRRCMSELVCVCMCVVGPTTNQNSFMYKVCTDIPSQNTTKTKPEYDEDQVLDLVAPGFRPCSMSV